MNRKASAFLIIALLAGFGYVLYTFLLSAYASDVYPPYSTQSTSRRGAKALYESLKGTGKITVRRHFAVRSRLKNDRPETMFFLGVRFEALRNGLDSDVRTLLEEGDRVVVSLAPPSGDGRRSGRSVPRGSGEGDRDVKNGKDREGTRSRAETNPFREVRLVDTITDDALREATRVRPDDTLPARVPIRSRYRLDLPDRWTVRHALDGRPVVMDRTLAGGTLVLIAGSYPFTNYALRDHRVPGLVTWCIGSNRAVVFDETHFGIENAPGIMNLARDYGLLPCFLSLVVLGGLYVWKSGSSLVPPFEERGWRSEREAMTGKGADTGLTNLIRSGIPARNLLNTVLQAYRTDAERGWLSTENLEEAERKVAEAETTEADEQSLVNTYRELDQIINSTGGIHEEDA